MFKKKAHTQYGVFSSEIARFKFWHPLAWRRAEREHELEGRIYDAIAGTLKAHGIEDKRGPEYQDEPSWDLMVAVMRVLKREGVKF